MLYGAADTLFVFVRSNFRMGASQEEGDIIASSNTFLAVPRGQRQAVRWLVARGSFCFDVSVLPRDFPQ